MIKRDLEKDLLELSKDWSVINYRELRYEKAAVHNELRLLCYLVERLFLEYLCNKGEDCGNNHHEGC